MGKPYERPVAPDESKQGAADAIEATRAQRRHEEASMAQPLVDQEVFGVQHQPGTGMSRGVVPMSRGEYAAEQAAQREAAAPANGKRPDAILADAISPQMGLGFDVEVDSDGSVRRKRMEQQLGRPLTVEESVRLQQPPPGLADKFIVPPFSVLDTRAGYWQERRRAWLSIGFRGETTAEHAYVPDSSGNSKREASGVYGGAGGAPAPLKRALNTTAGEHEADGTAVARAHAEAVDNVPPSADPQTYERRALGASGRAGGMVYGATAPGGDPSFYDKKAAVERELGRTISTEEFQRDHYEGRAGIGQSESVKTGTSVFDPVLCEIGYRWFSGEGGQVLDPFAGGVVRGAVAAILGRRYWGCELRPEQIADNRAQADALFSDSSAFDFGRRPERPEWVEGDARHLADAGPPPADLVFTCPPYGNLEVYSDDPRDLSTMTYRAFLSGMYDAMKASTDALRDDRFSVWVVGEFRDKAGCEAGFVSDTVQLAMNCGLRPYNTAILLNSVGSAALRAQMILRSRKLTRVHQTVLVFVKGDPKRAAASCGVAEVAA